MKSHADDERNIPAPILICDPLSEQKVEEDTEVTESTIFVMNEDSNSKQIYVHCSPISNKEETNTTENESISNGDTCTPATCIVKSSDDDSASDEQQDDSIFVK